VLVTQQTAHRGAWIDIPDSASLPTHVENTIMPIADKIGFIPNVARLLAVTPAHFLGWWSYFDDLMRGPSGLTKTQREMVAVVISAEARCPYCEIAHAAALRLRVKDAALVDRLAVNYRHVDLSPQDLAMLDFAVHLTQSPESCGELELERLREVGFTDEDILHLVEITAIFNYNVRLATATGLFPNPEYHELGR
jgi:uncharacterized peroxidase-related enzyme